MSAILNFLNSFKTIKSLKLKGTGIYDTSNDSSKGTCKAVSFSKFDLGNFLLKAFEFYVVLIWFQEVYLYAEFNLHVHIKPLMWALPLLLTIAVFYLFRKSFENYRLFSIENSKITALGLVVLLLVLLTMGVFKDTACDTFNYHLISQEPRLRNFFTESFGEGNFQVWGFRLGDRLFYEFRHLFGYRFGPFLNIICCVIIFYQLRSLLIKFLQNSELLNSFSNCIKEFIVTLLAVALVVNIHILNESATYYVDIVAIPLCLKAIDIVVFEKSYSYKYLAFLLGLVLAFKLTNIVYVAPLSILLVVKNIKEKGISARGVSSIATCAVLAVIPSLVYLAFAYQCTDNPLFPYYNSIFKSEYFGNYDFKDLRWGGQSLLEKIFWIYSAAFNPFYRLGECADFYDFILIGGVIAFSVMLLLMVIANVEPHINSKENHLIISKFFSFEENIFSTISRLLFILILSAILWGFSTGIVRYYMIGLMLFSVCLFCMIFNLKFKKIVFRNVLFLFVCALCLVNVYRVVNINFYTMNFNWSKATAQNVKNAISDLLVQKKLIYTDDSDLHIVPNYRANGFSYLANKNIPKLYLEYLQNYYPQDKQAIIDKYLNKAQKISVIQENNFYDLDEDHFVSILNDFGLYITSVEELVTEYGYSTKYNLVKAKDFECHPKNQLQNHLQNQLYKFKDNVIELPISNLLAINKEIEAIGSVVLGDRAFEMILCRKLNDFKSDPFSIAIYADVIDEQHKIYFERFTEYSPKMIKAVVPQRLNGAKAVFIKLDFMENGYYGHKINGNNTNDEVFIINPKLKLEE
jgi:hypothetical protein